MVLKTGKGYFTYNYHDKEHEVQSHRAVLHLEVFTSLSRFLLSLQRDLDAWLKWTEIALDNVINDN